MNSPTQNLALHADAAKDILIAIKSNNERFYNEFVREFLTDRLTFTNFERDLVNALHTIAGITIFRSEIDLRDDVNKIHVKHGKIIDSFDDFESAFNFAIAILTFA